MGNTKDKTLVYDISEMTSGDLEDLKKEMREVAYHSLDVAIRALDHGTLVGCIHDHLKASIDSDKKLDPCGFCLEVPEVTH